MQTPPNNRQIANKTKLQVYVLCHSEQSRYPLLTFLRFFYSSYEAIYLFYTYQSVFVALWVCQLILLCSSWRSPNRIPQVFRWTLFSFKTISWKMKLWYFYVQEFQVDSKKIPWSLLSLLLCFVSLLLCCCYWYLCVFGPVYYLSIRFWESFSVSSEYNLIALVISNKQHQFSLFKKKTIKKLKKRKIF